MPSSKDHWESIYSTKTTEEMSWTQASAFQSLSLITKTGLSSDARIIDVGGGVSVLPSELLALNFTYLTVLDISSQALGSAQIRLGANAGRVRWIEGDITSVSLPSLEFDLWHDRAVFHFLITSEQRTQYVSQLRLALKPGGFLIIGVFSMAGPLKCSGLPIVRYDTKSLEKELGDDFSLQESHIETHCTPWKSTQSFLYCLFQKK